MKKQLNNPNNGHFIRISQIDILRNSIVFKEFETIILDNFGNVIKEIVSSESLHKFSTINLLDYLCEPTNFYELCLETLKSEKFPTLILGPEGQNWLYENKTLCIAVDNKENTKQLAVNESYNFVMQRILTDIPDRVVQDTYTLLYCNTIAENDLPIILDFINVWIFPQPYINTLNINVI